MHRCFFPFLPICHLPTHFHLDRLKLNIFSWEKFIWFKDDIYDQQLQSFEMRKVLIVPEIIFMFEA